MVVAAATAAFSGEVSQRTVAMPVAVPVAAVAAAVQEAVFIVAVAATETMAAAAVRASAFGGYEGQVQDSALKSGRVQAICDPDSPKQDKAKSRAPQ